MNKKLEILISSYIDGECEHPEIIEDMLKQNKEAETIYKKLLSTRQVKNLNYKKCPIPFEKIILSEKKEPIKQLLVTAGVVVIAILCLLPLIKNSQKAQQFKTEISTEASR
jgi:hypothetical protein